MALLFPGIPESTQGVEVDGAEGPAGDGPE